MGYGTRSSIGVKGMGIYVFCEDCDASSFCPDWEVSTEDEVEWFKASPFSEHEWVTSKEIKDGEDEGHIDPS
jgi:hypothetical protein